MENVKETLNAYVEFVTEYGSYDDVRELRRLMQLQDINGVIGHCNAVIKKHLKSIV